MAGITYLKSGEKKKMKTIRIEISRNDNGWFLYKIKRLESEKERFLKIDNSYTRKEALELFCEKYYPKKKIFYVEKCLGAVYNIILK